MIPIHPPVEILQKAFPGIHAQEAEQLVQAGEVCAYAPSAILCRENAVEDTFYILLDGEVRVTKQIEPGEVRVLSTLGVGDFFGEMALIHNAPRAATVTATSRVRVLEIRKGAFNAMLRQHSSVSLAMVREVSRRLRENDQMAIEDLRLKARELASAYQQFSEQDYARQEYLDAIAQGLSERLPGAYRMLRETVCGNLAGAALTSGLERVEHDLRQMISLVNDLLSLQEMDLILLDFVPVNVGELAAAALERRRSLAASNELRLSLEVQPDMPLALADAASLERVILILLDNAIKYSPDGGEVRVTLGYDPKQLFVQVSDTGVGIPPEAMPRLFRRFFRLDEVGGHVFTGAGPGLSIARQVVEQHGGVIDVVSALGKGSSFIVRLPCK